MPKPMLKPKRKPPVFGEELSRILKQKKEIYKDISRKNDLSNIAVPAMQAQLAKDIEFLQQDLERMKPEVRKAFAQRRKNTRLTVQRILRNPRAALRLERMRANRLIRAIGSRKKPAK